MPCVQNKEKFYYLEIINQISHSTKIFACYTYIFILLYCTYTHAFKLQSLHKRPTYPPRVCTLAKLLQGRRKKKKKQERRENAVEEEEEEEEKEKGHSFFFFLFSFFFFFLSFFFLFIFFLKKKTNMFDNGTWMDTHSNFEFGNVSRRKKKEI